MTVLEEPCKGFCFCQPSLAMPHQTTVEGSPSRKAKVCAKGLGFMEYRV